VSPQELLELSDEAIAALYSEWSEENWAAGWIGNDEAEFVEAVLSGRFPMPRAEFADYQISGIAEIRRLAAKAAGR